VPCALALALPAKSLLELPLAAAFLAFIAFFAFAIFDILLFF
jgi:hypothetical protein